MGRVVETIVICNMKLYFSKWAYIRILIYIISIYSGFTNKNPIIDIPWYIYILVSILFAFCLYFIIAQQCSKSLTNISYKEAFSISLPFYPMSEYPLQFWIFISLCSLLRGLASLLAYQFLDLTKLDHFPLILGSFMLFSIILVIKNSISLPIIKMDTPDSNIDSVKAKSTDKLLFYCLIFGIFFIFFAFGISQSDKWNYSFLDQHGVWLRADHPLYFLLGECLSITIGLTLCAVSIYSIFRYYKK